MIRTSFLSLGVLLLGLGAGCGEPTPANPFVSPEEEQRAAFKILNTLFIRIDDYLGRLKNAELKAGARASAEALKKRRDALRTNFSPPTYEELLLDVTLDVRRLAAWVEEETLEARAAKRKK